MKSNFNIGFFSLLIISLISTFAGIGYNFYCKSYFLSYLFTSWIVIVIIFYYLHNDKEVSNERTRRKTTSRTIKR